MRVTTDQEKYLNEVYGLKNPEFARIRAHMDEGGVERISISGAEARMLQFLIRLAGVRTIVEFGTLYGYSALAMAQALPDDGRIYTLEKEPRHHAEAAKTFAQFPVGKKVRSLCGDAADLMKQIEGEGPFDMAFIDADKTGYPKYLDWAEKNVRRGGLIVGDNTFLWGGVYGDSGRNHVGDGQVRAMREFNQRLSDPAKYNSTLIPTVEGLTVAQKL